VLVLSMFNDNERVARALEAGALGYATKEQSADEVLTAIRTVGQGKAYLAPSISRFVIDDYMRLRKGGVPGSPLSGLTAREREIFDLTVRGFSSQGIASQLSISRRTVETHRSRILHKLQLHSASDLVRLAARTGLLPD
jgi:two-component system response regulator NreC